MAARGLDGRRSRGRPGVRVASADLGRPLVDLRLFRIPAFAVSLATYTLGIFAAFGTSLFIAQYLQLVLGMSPLEAGLWTVPEGAGFVAGAMLTPRIVRRVPPSIVAALGMVLAAFGFAVLVGVGDDAGLARVVTGSVLFALGLGSVFTLVNDLVVGTAPLERAGSASAMSETGAELGGALGIAILGQRRCRDLSDPARRGDPSGAVSSDQADAATETLGAALEVAGGLPARVGGELADAARAAFTSGMRATAVIAAAISVGVAVLIVAFMRPSRLRQREIRSEGDER